MTFVAGTVLTAAALNSELAAKIDTAPSASQTITGGVSVRPLQLINTVNIDPATGVAAPAIATLLLTNTGGTQGAGNLGSALGFSTPNSGRRGALIAGVQGTADPDQCGLSFYTKGSTPTNDAVTERMTIGYDGWMTGTTGSLGAWTSYAVALSASSGWTKGNATLTGAYTRVGKIVEGFIELSPTDATTIASGELSFTLPLAPQRSHGVFSAELRDNDTAVVYHGSGRIFASGTVRIQLVSVVPVGSYTQLNPTTYPFTPAAGDWFRLSFTYETSA